MSKLIRLTVLALCLTTLLPTPLLARDDGRLADSPLKPWFERLASGKGLCCSFADGFSVQDVDWDTQDGHYRVRIYGQWFVVPDAALVTEPNRFWSGCRMAVPGSRWHYANSLLHARCWNVVGDQTSRVDQAETDRLENAPDEKVRGAVSTRRGACAALLIKQINAPGNFLEFLILSESLSLGGWEQVRFLTDLSIDASVRFLHSASTNAKNAECH